MIAPCPHFFPSYAAFACCQKKREIKFNEIQLKCYLCIKCPKLMGIHALKKTNMEKKSKEVEELIHNWT